MAHYEITIHAAGPSRRADLSDIKIQSGDTLTFKAEVGAATILCLGAAIAGAITPPPSSSNVDLATGAAVSFHLGTVAVGSYCIVLQAEGWPVPVKIHCDSAADGAHLSIRSARPADFPGPDDQPSGT